MSQNLLLRRKFIVVAEKTGDSSSFVRGVSVSIIFLVASSALLLRYLHLEGIEAVFIELMAVPQVGFVFLGLASLVLIVTAIFLAWPIWLLGGMLMIDDDSKSASKGTDAEPSTASPPCFVRKSGLEPFWRYLKDRKNEKPKGLPFVAIVVMSLGWLIQFHILHAVQDWGAYGPWLSLVTVTFLAALLVTGLQLKSFGWGVVFFATHLFALFVVHAFFLILRKQGLDEYFSGVAAASFYALSILIYCQLSRREDDPAWWPFGNLRSWMPHLFVLLLLAAELLVLAEAEVLKSAARLSGVEGHNRVLLISPTESEIDSPFMLGETPPPGWHAFERSYHFGAFDVPCDAQRCYLVRNGVIAAAFSSKSSGD